MEQKISIFVGSVTAIKQGDLLVIQSLLVEVTKVTEGAFNMTFETMTNEGLIKEYTFGKEYFLSY